MNRSIISFMFAGLSTVLLAQPVVAVEQTTGADVSKQAGETWNTIKSYTLDKKSEAVAYGKQLMKDTDAKIAQLETKASTASGEAKVDYDKQIDHLKVVRANTAAKLDKMEKESGGAWNEAKQGFADAYKDLQRAYNKAAGKFK
jgi:hypothetical protein